MPRAKLPLGRQTLSDKGKGDGKKGLRGAASAATAAAVDATAVEQQGRAQAQEQDDRRPRKRAVVRTPRKQKVRGFCPRVDGTYRWTEEVYGLHFVRCRMASRDAG